MALPENSLIEPAYVADKSSVASFADLPWIKTEHAKLLWLMVKVGTAATGAFSFLGALGGTTNTFGLVLPSGLAVHYTASAGSVAVSGNTIALTGFSGRFAFCVLDLPHHIRPDYTVGSGGAAGANGFQIQHFLRTS